MAKQQIKSMQCRRCLGLLTQIDTEVKDKLTGKTLIVKKLLDPNYCEKCLKKEEARKRKLKRTQLRYGIKDKRKKKIKINWKDKIQEEIKFIPMEPIYVRRNKRKDILIKFSKAGKRWKKVTKRQLNRLQKDHSVLWNAS